MGQERIASSVPRRGRGRRDRGDFEPCCVCPAAPLAATPRAFACYDVPADRFAEHVVADLARPQRRYSPRGPDMGEAMRESINSP